MEMEFYNDDVTFEDPLISLSGPLAYRQNVEMLGGKNPLGKLLFCDCGLTMHNVTEGASPEEITTRWTLQFRFRLLPWAPLAQFTGISKYTLDRCHFFPAQSLEVCRGDRLGFTNAHPHNAEVFSVRPLILPARCTRVVFLTARLPPQLGSRAQAN